MQHPFENYQLVMHIDPIDSFKSLIYYLFIFTFILSKLEFAFYKSHIYG